MATSKAVPQLASRETDETPRSERSGETCPECGGDVRDADHERVCADCGLVVDADAIDHGPEWRSFDGERVEKRATKGRDPHMVGNNLGSEIAWKGEDDINGRQRALNSHAQSGTTKERNQTYGHVQIARMCSALELGESPTEITKRIYRQAHDAGAAEGRDLDTIAAACVHLGIRVTRAPHSVDDVAGVAYDDTRAILRRAKDIKQELDLAVPVPDPLDHVGRVTSEVDHPATERIRREAESLLERTDEQVTVGRSPHGVAAAAVWVAAGGEAYTAGELTQRAVAEAAGVCVVTVRNVAHDLGDAANDPADAEGQASLTDF